MRPSLALLGAALVLAGCNKPSAPDSPPEPAAPILQRGQLRFGEGHPHLDVFKATAAVPVKTVSIEMPARVVWNEERTQRIYPAFAGRVSSIRADVGSVVAANALLATIASPDFGAAQADRLKADADLRLAQAALDRQRELFNEGIVARKDLLQAESDAARAKAERARASGRIAMYGGGSDVDQALGIRSGIAGVVVERNLNPGQELRPDTSGPGTPPLFVVTDPTSLWVLVDCRENEARFLRPGSEFRLMVPALDRSFTGRITALSDAIDPATRAIRIRGVVANPDRLLKAEMLATAQIERYPGKGVVVPTSAVMLREGTPSVFVRSAPGVFDWRDVTVSFEGSKEDVLSRGIDVGDEIVTQNVLLLARQFRLAQQEARIEPGPQGRPRARDDEPQATK